MRLGEGGSPQWDRQTGGRLRGGGGYSTLRTELEGWGNERGPALPNCRTRPRGIGVFPSKQSLMAWRKMALHLSVILLGE